MNTSATRSAGVRARNATTPHEEGKVAERPAAAAVEVKVPRPLERDEEEVRSQRLLRLLLGAISAAALMAGTTWI